MGSSCSVGQLSSEAFWLNGWSLLAHAWGHGHDKIFSYEGFLVIVANGHFKIGSRGMAAVGVQPTRYATSCKLVGASKA